MNRPAAGRGGARGFAKRSVALGPGLIAGCAFVLIAWSARSGAAQVDGKAGATSPVADPREGGDATVEITVVGGPTDLQRIRSVIEPRAFGGSAPRWSRVARFDPMEILQAVHDSPSIVVHAWVDTSDSARARLYFAARSGERFLVRDVELTRGFDEVERESLSNVLDLSITALLENERAGLTRAEAQEVLAARKQAAQSTERDVPAVPTPEPGPARAPLPPAAIVSRPAAGSSRGFRVELRAFYGAIAPGGGLPIAHGPGLEVALAGRADDRPSMGAWLSGQYLWPARYSGASVGADLESIAARAGLEVILPVSAARVSARLGVGADAVHVSPRPGTADPSAMLTPPRWSEALAFTGAIGIRWTLGSRLLLGAAVFADVLPTVVDYDQAVGGVSSAVISPRRVRPGLMVELGIH